MSGRVSGRVTQHTIFTCRKNLSTDNVSQEAKLTFIKLIIYWTQGEKLSTKMKTTKFTQMCISSVLTPGPAAFGTSTSPLLQCTCLSMWSCEYHPMFAAGPSFSANNSQTAMTFFLIPIAHHNQLQPLINSLNSRAWWWAAHLELIPPYWAFHLATCKPINPNTHIYSTKSSSQMC
jgi:hypothetical protein